MARSGDVAPGKRRFLSAVRACATGCEWKVEERALQLGEAREESVKRIVEGKYQRAVKYNVTGLFGATI